MLESLELFQGDATPAQARVYARLPRKQEIGGAKIQFTGHLIGPSCDFAHTLPARIPFVQRRSDDRLLAEAIIPDPCFWTPDLPFLYRAELELRAGGNTLAAIYRTVGIRRLGASAKSLLFEGKRFVLRGVRRKFEISNLESQIDRDAAFARESWTAIVVASPDDELCSFAGRRGILLVADLTHREPACDTSFEHLRRLASWPAVGIAVMATEADLRGNIHDAAPNLLLAQQVRAGEPLDLKPWAQLALTESSNPADFVRTAAQCRSPLIACRNGQPDSLSAGRLACDTLQRDLAPYGDFAGYIV
jgi:hypothetical protein